MPAKAAPTDLTILELLSRFWTHAQAFFRTPDGDEAGELDNFRRALRPLKALYGPTPVAGFGPRALRAVRQRMIDRGWCRSAINRHVARIKHVFNWAVARELLLAAVYQALASVTGLPRGKSEAKESEPVRPVPQGLIDPVLPHVSPQVASMIRLQLLTGMRPGEVVVMRGVDIDMSEAICTYRPAHHPKRTGRGSFPTPLRLYHDVRLTPHGR